VVRRNAESVEPKKEKKKKKIIKKTTEEIWWFRFLCLYLHKPIKTYIPWEDNHFTTRNKEQV
jgi:hypothetical protein